MVFLMGALRLLSWCDLSDGCLGRIAQIVVLMGDLRWFSWCEL
jgi:hypothetical protein